MQAETPEPIADTDREPVPVTDDHLADATAAGAAVQASDAPAAPPAPNPRAVNPDMPRDMTPPKEGSQRTGSVPAVDARRQWARRQWSNWRLYLVRAISAGVSVILAVAIVPGLSFSGWRWGQGLAIAVVFAVLNAVVKPALQFLSLRFLFSSYGIVIVLINTLLLALLDWILGERIEASGVLPVLLGGALIGLIGAAIDAMLGADPPPLDREYKERNGLA